MASSSPTIEIINNVGQNDNRNKGPGAWVGWLIFFVVVILLFGVLPYFCATDFKFEFSKWAGWEKDKKVGRNCRHFQRTSINFRMVSVVRTCAKCYSD